MGDKKSDADMLNELSCIPSVAPRDRSSTLKNESKKPPVSSKFKNENEMNDYIQKCITDAIKKNGGGETSEAIDSKPKPEQGNGNGLLTEYNNPRKESSTGKHAGVNSFIRNLGTIGYGEERKNMVAHSAHANIKSSTKMAQNKGESKIAENILNKLNEREAKDKAKKKYPQNTKEKDTSDKSKFKSAPKKKKPREEEPQMLTDEKKHYPFTKVNSIFKKNSPQQPQQQQQQFMQPHQQQQQQQQFMQPHQQPQQQPQQQQQFMQPHQQQFMQPKRGLNMMNRSQSMQPNVITSQRSQQPNQMQRQQPNQMQRQQPNQMQRQQPNQMQDPNEIQNSFVFIMPSYNGAKWIKRIFDSIKSQTYQNYRIIYINDCSDDNTIAELNAYTKLHPNINIMLINNQTRQWPAYSRYVACREVYNNEICVFLDGDDWLVDNDCLKTLNTVFQNPNIYATFGSMENAPWQFKKWKKYNRLVINDGEGAYFPHLRTTRASIAKAIPPYYMQTETGDWLHVCTDVGLFMAVIEAVGTEGYVFLKNAFVHYNTSNHNKNTKEGYTNSKGSDMRIYYRSTIRDKIPMKKITQYINYNPDTISPIQQSSNVQQRQPPQYSQNNQQSMPNGQFQNNHRVMPNQQFINGNPQMGQQRRSVASRYR
jgi:glycosyltransferase involved in cell wall biosynthesis